MLVDLQVAIKNWLERLQHVPDAASVWHDFGEVVSPVENAFMTYLCDATLLLSVIVFLLLQFVTAPYGRHTGLSFLFGPGVNGRLAWILQEIPSLVLPVIIYFTSANHHMTSHIVNKILLGMFCLHYFNRSLIYPLRVKDPKPTPLFVALMAFTWCLVNGYLQGRYFCNVHEYDDAWLTNPQFLLGVFLFFFGFLANLQADQILMNLRKPGEKGYYIPRGGLFNFVSAANYFAETIEWTGFMIATNFSYPSVAFLVFTLANLVPRGISNHNWYLEKFKGEYPKERRAFFPFIL